MSPDVRDQVVDHIGELSELTELPKKILIGWAAYTQGASTTGASAMAKPTSITLTRLATIGLKIGSDRRFWTTTMPIHSMGIGG